MIKITKILGFLVLVVAIATAFTFSVGAREVVDSGICDEPNLTWTLYDDYELVISGSGNMVEWYNSAIATPWYFYCSSITSIIIEDGVTSITSGVFYEYDNLTSVKIGKDVSFIGEGAFDRCPKLTNFVIDSDNPYYSSDISGVLFNKNKTVLIEYYSGNPSTEYFVPSTVTSISENAFHNSCLAYITAHENNQYYSSENGVLFNKNRTDLVFYPPRKEGEYTIPGTVTTVKDNAFYHSRISEITIPNSVTIIGNSAFEGCHNLTNIEIPVSVKSIGNKIFYNCSNLKQITVLKENANYSDENGILFNKDKTTLIAYPQGNYFGYDGYIVPGSVTVISDYAFYGGKVKNIILPEELTSIGNYAFSNSSLVSVLIPNSVTSIGEGCFESCWSLENITIPNAIKEIPDNTFRNSGLKYITIPSGVTTIGNNAFGSCVYLANITIPNSVIYIGDFAFSGCPNLTDISIPDSVTYVGPHAFMNCSNLKNISLSKNLTIINVGTFTYCTSLESITIPSNVTTINNSSFLNCTNLVKIVIPRSVTTIKKGIFNKCPNLTIYGYTGSTAETYASENNIPFVALKETLYGDVNADGQVNRQDLLRLGKHFSGWIVEIDETGADVTGDGVVNRQDLLRLGKHFSGWDVVLGK